MIDSELLPLLVVVVLVLRTSAQARQEAHLSSPESTPPAGGKQEAKIPQSFSCLDGGFVPPEYQQTTARSCQEVDQFFQVRPEGEGKRSGEQIGG